MWNIGEKAYLGWAYTVRLKRKFRFTRRSRLVLPPPFFALFACRWKLHMTYKWKKKSFEQTFYTISFQTMDRSLFPKSGSSRFWIRCRRISANRRTNADPHPIRMEIWNAHSHDVQIEPRKRIFYTTTTVVRFENATAHSSIGYFHTQKIKNRSQFGFYCLADVLGLSASNASR